MWKMSSSSFCRSSASWFLYSPSIVIKIGFGFNCNYHYFIERMRQETSDSDSDSDIWQLSAHCCRSSYSWLPHAWMNEWSWLKAIGSHVCDHHHDRHQTMQYEILLFFSIACSTFGGSWSPPLQATVSALMFNLRGLCYTPQCPIRIELINYDKSLRMLDFFYFCNCCCFLFTCRLCFFSVIYQRVFFFFAVHDRFINWWQQ